MKYLGAYMLATLGGKSAPTSEDVKTILSSCGIESDADTLSKLMAAVDGKDINEVIAEGMSKLASVPSGGGGGGGGGGSAAAPAADAPAAAAKEESESEEEDGADFDLFD
jgi:large subunit ribosomal protein LP2